MEQEITNFICDEDSCVIMFDSQRMQCIPISSSSKLTNSTIDQRNLASTENNLWQPQKSSKAVGFKDNNNTIVNQFENCSLKNTRQMAGNVKHGNFIFIQDY